MIDERIFRVLLLFGDLPEDGRIEKLFGVFYGSIVLQKPSRNISSFRDILSTHNVPKEFLCTVRPDPMIFYTTFEGLPMK